MKEKNINSLFLIFTSAVVAICFLAIFFNLKAYILYKKASVMEAPAVKIEKINYYNNAISLVSQAVSLNRINADYLALEADLLFGAFSENLNGMRYIKEKEIENLYIKAISLNPINFEYHLKLGWFYAQVNKGKAEEEIRKSIELYPAYYRNYLYFSKYCLKNQKQKEAFSNILLTLYHGGSVRKIINEIKEDFKDSAGFYLDEKKRQLSFVVFVPGPDLDFKKYEFPHIKTPLSVKVYMKKSENQEVLLYKNNYLLNHFKKIPSEGETDIYEFSVTPDITDAYLDELMVKTRPAQGIEKIEFIKKYQ
ncbi:MAG: hypothetical protein WC330_06235 [Candidatus Omnitrophota bacterium]|jgi:tetratricopeptide (TPR) repeat protein